MPRYNILDKINSPFDLRFLSAGQVTQLCGEIRQLLVESVSKTGGHLASNLGVVELTVALHRVFRSPEDQIVWDVGHQSYTHKILTGRKDRFATLRQEGGLCGFPKSKESIHDAFLSGHSSTSVTVADGLAKAKRIKGEGGHVIAVIGDGAFTGGMAFEGLNNAARDNKNLIIILNDNKMSISKNVGSLSGYLTRLRTNKSYFKLKDLTKSALRAIPLVGESVLGAVATSKGYLKNAVFHTSFFEELGFVHMGPVNGHDVQMLSDVLERAKTLDKPVFIHVETVKGKGYSFAEKNPGAYHGVSKFNPSQGNEDDHSRQTFSDVFGKYLTGLALKDQRICAVTAAMKYGTGLNYFSHQLGKSGRFFDVGIAEQHAVTFSAALASKNLLPVFAVYSSFLQRAVDQLIHDCAIEPRHVVVAVDRAGLVGEDGETHHGLFDCAVLSAIPGAVLYSPATFDELRHSLYQALYHESGLCAVRYPRGGQPALPEGYEATRENFTHWQGDGDVLLVTYGREWAEVCWAREQLAEENISTGLLKLNRIFPIDREALAVAHRYRQVIFVEEGIQSGGIGEHFVTELALGGYRGGCTVRAVENRFVPQATVASQIKMLGLCRDSIAALVREKATEGNDHIR